MRLASTTSNGGSPLGQAPSRAREAAGRAGCAGRWRVVASMAIGSVSIPSALAAPSLSAAMARIPDPHPTSRTRAPASTPRSASASVRGEAQARGRMEPGPERHPRIQRQDDVAGRAAVAPPGRPDDQPPPDAQDREVRLPGVGPVGLVDDPRPQLADRAQAERLEVAERLGHLGRGAVGGRRGREPAGRRGRWPAGSGRAGRRGPRRPARTRARPTSRRAPPGRGSR